MLYYDLCVLDCLLMLMIKSYLFQLMQDDGDWAAIGVKDVKLSLSLSFFAFISTFFYMNCFVEMMVVDFLFILGSKHCKS